MLIIIITVGVPTIHTNMHYSQHDGKYNVFENTVQL